MAPNKKKGRGTNKKKNKGQNRQAKAGPASASRKHSAIRDVPTFHHDDVKSGCNNDDNPYERHKKCTGAFRDWLVRNQFAAERVIDLKKSVDEIYDRSLGYYNSDDKGSIPIVIPREVMNNLSECIDLREQVSAVYGKTPDKGHLFMIDTLKYCRRMLGFSRNVVRVAVADSPVETKDEIGGRFNALLEVEEDEQEEYEIDAESIRSQEVVHVAVEEPSEPEYVYTMDDLINGDDRFQASSFIKTMNDLMNLVEVHYGMLKQVMRGEAQHLHDTSSFVQLALECAVVANMTTESVCAMEAALAANHPHLSSFYAVLALVFLYPIIADIEKEIGPTVRSNSPNIAKCFTGDIVECCFRNKGDPVKIKSIVKQFSRDAAVTLPVAEKFAQEINTCTSFEIQMACEERGNAQGVAVMRGYGYRPHMWLEQFPSLADDKSLLNTQKLVQNIMDIVTPDTRLVPKPGFFGTTWDESSRPAARIRGEMDQVFAGDILPELIEWAKHTPVSILPNQQELIPILSILSRHVKNRKEPVPASVTFGLQTILVSLFLLQGDGDVNRLAESFRQSYSRLFDQLQEDSTSERPQPPLFHRNMQMFTPLRNLPSTGETSSAAKYAFWNPVVGGEFLLYGTFITSIGLGSATVDTLGQLRFTLHLYNALRKCMLIQDNEFLSTLDKIFENCKAIWVAGRRPDKGSFAKHFWLAWGYSLEEATNMSRSTPSFDEKKNTTRKLDEILPEDYSESYKRLVKRDFSRDNDDYSVVNVTREHRKTHESLFGVISRVNMTRDSMDEDENALPIDFTRVGCVLIDFICDLSKAMGWDEDIDPLVATCPREVRYGNRADGRRARAGGFETSDTNLKWQALACTIGNMLHGLDADGEKGAALGVGVDAAAYMNEYFGSMDKDHYTFVAEASEADISMSALNPLLGSYPPGRTGRTMRDPLPSFVHFKYFKRGTPVFRYIVPGKRTPLVIDASLAEQCRPDFDRAMHVETPYEEAGCKQQRQSNGKYRHIADYSLDELIALGWDGAKYVAQGNHAAKGLWCPFVCGYDSDSDNEYDTIDVTAGKKTGTVGLTDDEVGLYMDVAKKGVLQLGAGH